MTKDELIRALEAATGPSRGLDDAIWAIHKGYEVRWIPGERPYFLVPRCYCANKPYHAEGAPHWQQFEPGNGGPNYTASIDAALTLVPEGWQEHWYIHVPGYDEGRFIAPAKAGLHHRISSGGGPRETGFAATPAIALVISALKARP